MSKELKRLKVVHDMLVAIKPDGVDHPADCELCLDLSDNDHPGGGSMSDKTFTEEELAAAVQKAVGEATSALQAKLTELENSQQQTEMDKGIAAAKAELQSSIDELQTKLDAAVLEATAAKDAKAELEQFWSSAV